MLAELTEHFSIREAIRSSVAVAHKIDNTPDGDLLPAIRRTAEGMERIRAFLGYPIKVQSWYRCPQLNQLVGGSRTSQHLKGEAVDFTCPVFGTPRFIVRFLAPKLEELQIDQLILEDSWVHVSFAAEPRREVLTASWQEGKRIYTKGIA